MSVDKQDSQESYDNRRKSAEYTVTITGDISGSSTGVGEYEDFHQVMQSRYRQLRSLLNERPQPIRNISSLKHTQLEGDDVLIAGVVFEKRTSYTNDNPMLVLEGEKETIRVVFTDEESEQKWQEVVQDEVVAVRGQLGDNIIFGDDILFPEVPNSEPTSPSTSGGKVVLISDTHFGSQEFQYKKWERFVEWVNSTPEVDFILIAGDLIEGIGIYPGQEDELEVASPYEQYKMCANALDEINSNVEIYSIVGNHDTPRLAEPQVTIQDRYRELFGENVSILGNPAEITINGVRFLLYHGVSLQPLLEKIPNLDIQKPAEIMKYLLQKRHLAPLWGDGVRIAPEKKDHLVINQVPHVLHTGHLHTYQQKTEDGVLLANTGTWQGMTDYQKSKNVSPDVGFATVVDLDDYTATTKSF